MSVYVKRLGLLAVALVSLSISLAACAVGQSSSSSPSLAPGISFVTPDPAQASPTPSFPPFTIGAWVSNYSPNQNDTVTIYVLCRVQDPTMQTPSVPPPTPVHVRVALDQLGAVLEGDTDKDGIAAISYTFNDPNTGQPVDITVTASYQGHPYIARTFFTPGINIVPTATPGGTPGPTATP
jgi:hypothetical protein